jgi:hypothetical protein
MFRQLRVKVVVPVNSKPSTATHNGRGGLQDYFTDDVYGQPSCMVFHTEQLVVDRVFMKNLSKCGHVVNNCRHHSHEMSDRKTRVKGRSPYLPLRAVTSQHITTSSYDREGLSENF